MSSTSQSGTRTAGHHGPTAVQKAARLVGIVFLAVGLLGFIPGITSNYDEMAFAGHQSDAMLLGLFQVSILHNIVHLLYGAAGLALSRSIDGSKKYFLIGGAVYLLLFVYGLAVGNNSDANFVPLNLADDLLHLVLGLGMIALGVLLTRRPGLERHTDVAHQ